CWAISDSDKAPVRAPAFPRRPRNAPRHSGRHSFLPAWELATCENSPLVRTALLPSFANGVSTLPLDAFSRAEKSLFGGFQGRINASATSALFCQAKEGERQRSTPPQEPPIGRAASIRTCCSARKRCGAQKARAKRTQRSSMV